MLCPYEKGGAHSLSDVLGSFPRHFSEYGPEIIRRGEANLLADLIHGHIRMSEHIEGVLYHYVMLIGYGTYSRSFFEEIKKRRAADVTALAQTVDLKGLGVVAFDVCYRLLHALVEGWA